MSVCAASNACFISCVWTFLFTVSGQQTHQVRASVLRQGISCGSSNLRDLAVEPMVLETIHSGLQFRDDVAREFIACISKAPLGSPQVRSRKLTPSVSPKLLPGDFFNIASN